MFKFTILSVGTNAKLGKHVASWSRSVGPTCPRSCPFLSGIMPDGSTIPEKLRCYAADVVKRYRSVGTKWGQADTVGPEWADRLSAELVEADRKGIKAVRFHVGGDFGKADGSGELDRTYLAAVLSAVRSARVRGATIPLWGYSHLWEKLGPFVRRFRKLGMELFASVHSDVEAVRAVKLGFRLAVDPGAELVPIMPGADGPDMPSLIRAVGRTVSVCPHQRGKISDCGACRFCFRPIGRDIAFVRH